MDFSHNSQELNEFKVQTNWFPQSCQKSLLNSISFKTMMEAPCMLRSHMGTKTELSKLEFFLPSKV